MSGNVWQYALLGGIKGGADGLAQGMAEQQRFERERQLMAEREAERRRYLDEQNANYIERNQALIAARGGSTGSSSGSSGRGGGGFDTAVAEKELDFITKDDPERIAQGIRDDGGQVIKRLGANPGDESTYDTSNELWQRKRAELQRLRKGIVHGKEYKDVQEGELLERAGQGDDQAKEGVLLSKGKGRKDGLAGGVGVFDAIDGKQTLNAVGTSAASENNAQANKANNDAKKLLAEIESSPKSGSPEKLYQQISSIRPVTENMAIDEETRKQATRVLRALMSEVEKARGGAPAPAPAEPAKNPRGGASAPKPAAPKVDNAAAEAVRARYRNGEISREQAKAELQKLGFK